MSNGTKTATQFIPIRLKLLATTIVTAFLAVVIALAGLYCMHLLSQRLGEVVDVASHKVKLTNLLRQELSSVMHSERNMMLVTDEKEFDRVATTMNANFESMDKHISQLRSFFEKEDEEQLDQFVDRLSKWKENHKLVRQYSGLDTQRQARELSFGPGETAFNGFESVINELVSDVSSSNTLSDHPSDDKEPRQPTENVDADNGENPSKINDDTVSTEAQGAGDSDDSAKNKILLLLAELRRDALKLQRVEKNLILQASIATVQKPEDTIAPFRQQVIMRLEAVEQELEPRHLPKLAQAKLKLNEYLKVNDEIVKVVQEKGNAFGFQLVRSSGEPLARACQSLADQMVANSELSLDDYERESITLFNTFRNTLVGLSIVAVGTGMFVSLRVGSRIASNIRQLSGYASHVHLAKDLTNPVPRVGNDEIGELSEAFEGMRISLLSQNSKLARLNETLEHKNDEMEQFVYSVSHDLKSPLVSCKGLVGLMKEDIADEDFNEVQMSAERLSAVVDQMSNTIDDLLTFSRLGRKSLEMEVVNVQKLVNQLCDEWQERNEAAHVTLEIKPDLHPIYADLISLRRVFDNLIGNAVKYASDGEDAKIEIGSEKHGRKIRYYVRDNGPGIEPQYHDKIFGLFQRLDTTKKGTGIGLASVAKIVRQHRGKVWVESEPGQGAVFWIELPNTNPLSDS